MRSIWITFLSLLLSEPRKLPLLVAKIASLIVSEMFRPYGRKWNVNAVDVLKGYKQVTAGESDQ